MNTSQGYIKNILKNPDGSEAINENVAGIAFKTSTPLGSNGTISTGWIPYNQYVSGTTVLFSDAASAASGLLYEYSTDGGASTIDVLTTSFTTINDFRVSTYPLSKGTHIRITYTNGTTAQTKFYFAIVLGLDLVNSQGSVFTKVNTANIASITKTFLQLPDSNLDTAAYDFVTRTGNALNVNTTNNISGFNLETTQSLIKINSDNLDVALSTRLKPSDTLTKVATIDTITNVVSVNDNGGSITIDAVSLPLPTGAATSALQTTQDTSINSLLKPASTLNKVSTLDTITNALPVGTNTIGNVKLTDGTNIATVKAASTAAIAADPAIVVAISPNNIVSDNIAQINGTTINTGVGAAGTGTQRVAVSQDSKLNLFDGVTNLVINPASTVAATTSTSIPIAILPNNNLVKLTDGTNTATIKAASTPASATDTSVVVTMSPNSSTTNTSDASNGSVIAGVAGTKSSLAGLQYNSTAPTLTTGQQIALQGDVNGKLQTISNIGSNIYTQSTGNNTSAQLAVSSSFVGAIESVLSYPQIILSVRCNQAFTLTIQQFSDLAGTIIYPDIIYKRIANEGLNQPITLSGSYYRIVILNTGLATTTNLFAETWYGTISATPNLTTAGNMPVEQIDIAVTGQSAQTAIINNILTPISGATSTDVLSYRSAAVQVVSTGTGGTFIFEGSNDNTNFQTIGVVNKVILTGTIINGAITATASQFIYVLPIDFRYIRLRIVTAITGGNIQAFSRYSQLPFQPLINQIAQNTASSLQTTATQSGTWTTNTGLNAIVADVASAALTVTTTTAAITPTLGTSYEVNIPVTVVTGTSPTLQVTIQESDDTGTNWFNVYDFPTIIAVGIYRSPVLTLTGNRIRYVQTVTGTTPSFTRSIGRLQSNQAAKPTYVGQAVTVSSTITTGGTAQIAIAANPARKNFEIQNLSSGDLFISIGSTASATNGFLLPTKGMYSEPAGYSSNVAISIFGATTGQLYTYIQR